METKKFNKFEIATIKRTAKNVNIKVTKKNKIRKQIAELQEELNTIEVELEQYEAPIRNMTGGYTTEDLVDKVIEVTDSKDKNGNPVKITKYVLKYPETVIPSIEHSDNVDNVEEKVVEDESDALPFDL